MTILYTALDYSKIDLLKRCSDAVSLTITVGYHVVTQWSQLALKLLMLCSVYLYEFLVIASSVSRYNLSLAIIALRQQLGERLSAMRPVPSKPDQSAVWCLFRG